MSQPTTLTSSTTVKADSVTPQPSWIPLIKPSLFRQAINKYGYVSPDTDCFTIYGPKPAIFDDGQTLSTTHYHIDAGFWEGDRFIDGATFLVPSKIPMVGLERYLVDLDETTGVHHVTLRKVSPRTILPLTNLAHPGFSSHVVEFSNGEMTAVPRVNCVTTRSKRKARKTPSREYKWASSIAQPRLVYDTVRLIQLGILGKDNEIDKGEPASDQVANSQPRLAGPTVSAFHGVASNGTKSAPIRIPNSTNEPAPASGQVCNDRTSRSATSGSLLHEFFPNLIFATSRVPDSSITASGQVVGQLPADDRSSLSNFPKSFLHVVRRNATASNSIAAEGSDAPIQAQEPVETTVDVQTSDISSTSRRSSTGSQSSGTFTSTVPTSPSSSTLSTMPFWKSALANLPKVPIAPGKCTYVIEALALEKPKIDELEKTDEPDETLIRRLSWDLRISYRQLTHWNEIQSPYLKDVSTSSNDLAITEDGQILVVEDVSNTSELFEETGHDAAANQSSGFLDIAPKGGETQDLANSSGSLNIGEMIENLFGDDEDGFTSTPPLVNIPRAPPVLNTPSMAPANSTSSDLKGTTASVPFRLGSSIPVDAINAINTEFFRLWNEGVSGRCWVPGQDEDEVQILAVANVASFNGDLPNDIVSVTKDFNEIVAELWEEGHPQRPLVRGSEDDQLIHELARRNLEWKYFSSYLKHNLDQSTASVPTVQPRKTLEAAPSSFEWYLQALGGDDHYREHRSVRVAKVAENNKSEYDSRNETRFHHLNFNYDPVYERNYTPAEVSFWAASTTISKMLVPCAEHCLVHRVKVVTSQAFKKVDPVIYTGTNIQALRGLTGSAMRDAATSDVEVAYEAVGNWNRDRFDLENVEPRVVSVDDGDIYEHCESGQYNYLQRPYYINDKHDEHKLCIVNDHQSSNPPMSQVRLGYEQKFSNLGPFKGVKSPAKHVHMRYSGKCSSWDPPAQETTAVPETVYD